MTVQDFKKRAKETGRDVDSIVFRKDASGMPYVRITYSAILNEYSTSISQTRKFYKTLQEVLCEWERN